MIFIKTYNKPLTFKTIIFFVLWLIIIIFLFNYISHYYVLERFTVIVKEKFIYREFDNIFNPYECQKIISLSQDKLERSTTVGMGVIKERTSWHTWLGDDISFVYEFNQKLHRLINLYSNTKLDYNNTEKLQVVRYIPSQKYDAHYDVCHPDFQDSDIKRKHCDLDIKNFGSMRYATILVYLNDNFTGGETNFPKLNIKIKPKIGKVLIFYSLYPNLNIIDESLHAGLPVKSGIKWICNKWYRLEPFKR